MKNKSEFDMRTKIKFKILSLCTLNQNELFQSFIGNNNKRNRKFKIMKYLIILILVLNISCKDNYITIPRNLNEAKERKAFIKEFVGDKSIISINNKNYLIKVVYLTYLIDSKNVHKQACSLIIKTIDCKTQNNKFPMEYLNIKIKIDKSYFNVYNRYLNLVCDIPEDTKVFQLMYFENKIEKVINFKQK